MASELERLWQLAERAQTASRTGRDFKTHALFTTTFLHLVPEFKALVEAAEASINPNNGCTWECLLRFVPGNLHSRHCELTRLALTNLTTAVARQLGGTDG